MPKQFPVYLERGSKRVFAGGLDWPGWCRSGRDDAAALEALVSYGPRYAAAIRRARLGFEPPRDVSALNVVERLKGNATTDFGAPGLAPKSDAERIGEAQGKRLLSLLEASWTAFDSAAKEAASAVLRKGPRGGGRELDAIVAHVYEAEAAYVRKLGGKADAGADMQGLRKTIVEVFASRAKGEAPPRPPRSGTLWSPRYFARRSAWHALDHAWEIEDRAS
jgi:hypothetical protein